DVLTLNLLNAQLYLGNAPNTPVFSAPTAIATAPALLGDVSLTFTDLQFARDGTVSLASAAVTSANLLASFGLAGLIPFRITAARFHFPPLLPNGRPSLDTIDIPVDGNLVSSALAGLPFTPILTIGAVNVAAGDTFTFHLSVTSLAQGSIAPRNIGPITLG